MRFQGWKVRGLMTLCRGSDEGEVGVCMTERSEEECAKSEDDNCDTDGDENFPTNQIPGGGAILVKVRDKKAATYSI